MTSLWLFGCTAEPLGSYLKALAVLRLVAEQADPEARGWWDRACFCLESNLDEEALAAFFLKDYCPTPILAPWNGGSGFYPKDRKVGIEGISRSSDSRFALYREAIAFARSLPEIAQEKPGAKAEEDERRTAVLRACRNGLPDACLDWLDAAVSISAEGKRAFAPILGTGGNEGRLDYTNNFMEHLTGLLIAPDHRTPVGALLRNALFGAASGGFEPGSVGQYDPGRAGGFNQGQGVETADFPSNPWNFVLTLEGAAAWGAGLYRRQGVSYRSFLCSPFTVRASPIGYGSASANDRALARAEIWTPLWSRPARYAELKALLREGRAAVDSKPAQNGLEFAQAACMLGVDRGISGFVRYNLLKRRGDSYIALPAGRFTVTERRETDLVRQLTPLLEEADWQLGDGPAGYEGLRRQVDEAIYALLLRGGPDALRNVAASVGRLYRRILTMGKAVRISKRLGQAWLGELAHCPEARIAAAVAGIWHPEVGAFRNHLERTSAQFSWSGTNLAERMTRSLERRILLMEAKGIKHNPLGSSYRASARDVVLFLEESLDDELIEDLMFAFTLVDWRGADPIGPQSEDEVDVWPVYALLKHLFLPNSVSTPGGEVYLTGDLGVLAALSAGDVGQAARIAVRRLQNAGVLPVEADYRAGFDGMRLAASMLIPVPYSAALRQICN
jgi:CRISPR-associated protein Csx17